MLMLHFKVYFTKTKENHKIVKKGEEIPMNQPNFGIVNEW